LSVQAASEWRARRLSQPAAMTSPLTRRACNSQGRDLLFSGHPLRGKLPWGWECWVGVSGLLYARCPRSSPPIVVRDVTAEGLAAKVAEAEGKRR
jgi:hypothetical protein